ncbi:MAG: hypothetical protein KH431_00640 [Erysipelotrichaceae bacterium]|nr:hypothetical protein [Erysipelotrichaceae bacterium]
MTVILFIILIMLYLGNRRQGGAILRYCILQRGGFRNLQQSVIAYGYQYQMRQHVLICTLSAILVTAAGFLFQLQLASIMVMAFTAVLLMPLLVLWSASHTFEERKFNDLTNFLQHFIALFKLNPKLYQTLTDCEALTQGDLKITVQAIMTNIENGEDLETAFEPLRSYCPHFIIHNLLTITCAVEEHGSLYYQEGLDFIQDDIDDWIEDVYLFKKQQLQAKNRMLVLCAFAGLIAFVSKQMLAQIDFQVTGGVYQISMSLFFICIGVTIIMAHRILQDSWVDTEEYVCWES